MRSGFTTGTCASAASKAAALVLLRPRGALREVAVPLPDGGRAALPVAMWKQGPGWAEAAVRKDAGDDPDVTHGALVIARVTRAPRCGVRFRAGEGVGTVTAAGLALPPGEPAINPVPRRQIAAALVEVSSGGWEVTVSIPGGAALAARTFNGRLGVQGGLSILGTDGRVRPFSHERMVAAQLLGVDVAVAAGWSEVVLVPGHMGGRFAERRWGALGASLIEMGNSAGPMLDRCVERGIVAARLVGHPGKLAKLLLGERDLHSSRSASALVALRPLLAELGLVDSGALTVEGLFQSLASPDRTRLGSLLAERIAGRVAADYPPLRVSVWLSSLAGDCWGSARAVGASP